MYLLPSSYQKLSVVPKLVTNQVSIIWNHIISYILKYKICSGVFPKLDTNKLWFFFDSLFYDDLSLTSIYSVEKVCVIWNHIIPYIFSKLYFWDCLRCLWEKEDFDFQQGKISLGGNHVQTGSGTQPDSYPIGTLDFFPGTKRQKL